MPAPSLTALANHLSDKDSWIDGQPAEWIRFLDRVPLGGVFDSPGWTFGTTLALWEAQAAGIEALIQAAGTLDDRTSLGNDLLLNLWFSGRARFGSGADETLRGTDGRDLLVGKGGNDRIEGGDGFDALFGGAGDDHVRGGSGLDVAAGGAGADRLDGGGQWGDLLCYSGSDAGVDLRLVAGSVTTGRGGEAEGDRISGFTHVIGSEAGDVIADGESATLSGGRNANGFFGRGGADVLRLGGGHDLGKGGSGDDTVQGGGGHDLLFGGSGRDLVEGGSGNDLLCGGRGDDTLAGGAGADVFVWADPEARDVVLDFRAEDLLALAPIDADATRGGEQAFRWLGAAGFDGRAGALWTERDGGDLLLLGSTDADAAAEVAIRLVGASRLALADVVL